MKRKNIITAAIITVAISLGATGLIAHAAQTEGRIGSLTKSLTEGWTGSRTEGWTGSRTESRTEHGLSDEELAKKYPLEAVKQHALKAAETMDLPDDRLYGIITYGGEDHLMIAEEHKEEGHYGVEYIHTLIDTDNVDGYEPEQVDMYFHCPVCGSRSSAYISVGDVSPGRVYWCNCEEPWIIGVTIKEEEVR